MRRTAPAYPTTCVPVTSAGSASCTVKRLNEGIMMLRGVGESHWRSHCALEQAVHIPHARSHPTQQFGVCRRANRARAHNHNSGALTGAGGNNSKGGLDADDARSRDHRVAVARPAGDDSPRGVVAEAQPRDRVPVARTSACGREQCVPRGRGRLEGEQPPPLAEQRPRRRGAVNAGAP